MNETILVTNDVINIVASDSSDSKILTIIVPGPQGPIGDPMPLEIFIGGHPGMSELLLRYVVMRDTLTIANTSVASAETAPTANAVFTIMKNTTPIGTITFNAANTTGSINISNSSLVKYDILKLIGPVTIDSTLSDITLALDLYN